MKLKKFSKLTDIQKMAITFMIGIFLTIGCITLYKTFAIYKEETTFDVIEGTVPDFIKKDKDLEIAIMVDGESVGEVPKENKDYRVRVECDTEEISWTWNYNNWYADITGHITQAATCTIIFESIYDSIIVDGEEKDSIPDKGDYQYNLTCENVTNSTFDEESWKPVVTGVKENSSCNIVFKSTNNIITKIIDANGAEVESYPTKEEAYDAKMTCTNGSIGEWDKEAWKIKKIENVTNETTCEIEFSRFNLASEVSVGDYIAYTPAYSENNGKYKIKTDLTGWPSEQEINPSELNLWRVIKINEDDDTIEIVSEYASSKTVFFRGKEGYRKFVDLLNKIVREAYETEGITVASTETTNTSREIGYDGEQNECSAYNTCSDQKTSKDVESEEMRLIASNKVMGTRIATKPDGSSQKYWLASRYHRSSGDYSGRYVGSDGGWYYYDFVNSVGSDITGTTFAAFRPIVTLKSGLTATEGSKNGKKLWTIEQ